ncbi:MAG: hypothetical protein CVU05_09540, partial [Bacteroidetes bacterium HGW-Bacteroidetes-21]
MLNVNEIHSQCTNCNSNYPSGTLSTTSSTFTTVSTIVYGGEYSYYSVTSGQTYTWQTCGDTDYDTQLTLFQGSTCGSGTVLAYNDDGCGAQSTITWTATFTGTVTLLNSLYNCQNNSTGTTIQWACTSCGGGTPSNCSGGPACSATSPPANDNCSTPTPICEFEGYCGNTSASYTPGSIPASFCGSVENNSWLTFTATATTATLNVFVCNCINGWGIQMEIYSTTDCVNFISRSNCWNPGVQVNGTVTATGLTIGQNYLLMIDGNAGDVCNYTISAGSGVWLANAIITQTGTNSASICAGQTVNLQASGGTSYSWTPTTGLSNPNIANPTATVSTTTTYNCNITGGNPLCPGTQAVQVTVNVTPGLTINTSGTNPTCNGLSNGSVNITSVTGGTAPYTYIWSTGATTQNITSRPAGTYTVTVTSANGCTNSASVTLTNPAPLTLSSSNVAASCGSSNGTITVNVTGGGVANYTYTCPPATASGSTSATSYTFTGLAAGTYTTTVTNGSGCTATTSQTITSTGSVTSGFTYNGNQCLTGNSFNFTNTGTAGVTYAWTFPGATPGTSTAQNPTGIVWSTAGPHTVTQVVSLGSCTSTYTQTITVYAQPTATITPTNATCFGVCNGSALATGSGGSGTYSSYAWSNSGSTQNITGLCPGSYTVTITDSYGCKGTATTNITQPAALSIVTSRTNPTCNGSCNGTAQATVSGGTGTYNYLWSNSGTTANLTGLCAGTYTVTVTDAAGGAGCTQTASVVLTNPAAIVLTSSSGSATCGASNGSATVTITSGGSPNYTYNWSNSATTPNSPSNTNTITGLSSGAYTVTVIDASSCTSTTTINVNSTGAPTATITASNAPLCFGACNGTATVSIGGTLNQPFNYVWSTGSSTPGSILTTNSVSNLCNGSSNVTITDNLGCVATATVNLVQPTQVTTSTSTISSTCGLSNGSATVNPSGGTGTYTYLWNPGGLTTQTISARPAGVYNVTVTDGNGCTATNSATINNTSGVTASVSGTTQPLCFGGNNGTATAAGTGGTTPYTYLWQNSQTTQTATNLSLGSYNVTITDNSGCTSIATANITQPTQVTATISSSLNPTCNGTCNGTATVTPAGGTPTYTYLWSNTQTNPGATGLCSGTYFVTVRDANSCTATASVTLTQPTAVTATTTTISAHCNLPDGSATVTGANGSPGYTYLWNAAAGGQVTATATNLVPGSYTVTVSDINSCTTTAIAIVGNTPSGTATISNTTHVSCNGLCNGSITVSMSGGTSPYTYLWNPGGQTGITASNLCAGSYTVSVSDASGCVVTATSTVNQPTALSVTLSALDILCFGQCNGSISASPAGGTSPYTYQWTNTFFGANNTSLCSGAYTVTVTDNHGCTNTASYTLSNPAAITIAATPVSANCGLSDGSLSIVVTNGAPPLTYLWSPNVGSGPALTNIPAGTYNVTVTDIKSCTATGSYTVPDASGVTATLGPKTNVTCNGLCNGTASVTASGGVAPYTYLWSDPFSQTTSIATNLCAGNYSVSVIDNNGCIASTNVTITQPLVLAIANITSTSPPCNGSCNGTASVIVTGGTTPYNYSWSGGLPFGGNAPTAASTGGICSGAMTILITDANGCTTSGNRLINEPSFISLATTIHNETCSGTADGNVSVTALGGVPPYTYQWGPSTGNQTGSVALNLTGGTHSVTVTDANNCTQTISGTVATPNPMSFTSITPVHLTCFMSNNGSISVNVTGGTPPYSFHWTNSVGTYNSTNQNIGSLPAESYTVVVTDMNGCSITNTTIISQPPPLSLNLFHSDETCYSFCDGSITTAVNGGQLPYTYLWSNLNANANLNNLCPGTYSVTVSDNNGCTASSSATINGNPLLQVDLANITPATCGIANGSACVVFQGGTTGYQIQWSTGGNGTCETNMPAGNHDITVIDQNGCVASLNVSIQNFNGPSITSFIPTHVTCADANNGVAIVTYSPSSPPAPPYISTWSNSWVGDTATGLAGGVYFVTVTDNNGCQSTSSIVINEPTHLVSVINYTTNNLCFGDCNAMATAQAGGGVPPYSFNWLGIGQTGTTATGLCAGTYNIVVTDANSCTSTASTTVNQPAAITINGIVTDVLCSGNYSGIISTTTSGGAPPHQYIWLPPATGTNSVAANLPAGTFTIQVTDGNNCTITEDFTINQPAPLLVYTSMYPASCGNNTGSAQIDSITGGVSPYTYLWSPGNATTPIIQNLTNGIYQLQVTDANNCHANASVPVGMVTGPQQITFDITNALCNGSNTGEATANVMGGMAPYSYAWNIGQSSQTATSLFAGNYTVTVTDVNGCTMAASTTVGQPSAIQIFPINSDTICVNQTTIISATANGGVPPYEFYWSGPGIVTPNGQFQTVNPSATTNYSVYAMDANGCISNPPTTITVQVFSPIHVIISPDAVICEGQHTSIHVEASGGSPPYSYIWNSGSGNPNVVSPQLTTTYEVHVYDACTTPPDSATMTVFVRKAPTLITTPAPQSGCAPLVALFNALVDTGFTNVSYTWNFGDPA